MPNRDQSQNYGSNNNNSQNRDRDTQGRFADNDNSNSRQAGYANDTTSREASGNRSNTENNPGNFANNRERATEAGRKGGQNSHGSRNH